MQKKENATVSFDWIATKVENTEYKKGAIALPFKFKNNSHNFYFQLDTGTPTSYLFYDALKEHIDLEKYNHKSNVEIEGKLGECEVHHLFKLDKITKNDSSEKVNAIGLLGLDFLRKNKFFILNFLEQKLIFGDLLDSIKYDTFSFVKATFGNKFIVLQLPFENGFIKLLYDSGASLFDVIIDKENWIFLTKKTENAKGVFKLNVSGAFDTRIEFKSAKITTDFFLSPTFNLKGKTAYFIDKGSDYTDFSSIGINGLLGNSLFYEKHSLIFDFRNERVGLKENK